ncbi:MAG: DEAD/DEAH box helicase [Dermatophilaceae bacterium]
MSAPGRSRRQARALLDRGAELSELARSVHEGGRELESEVASAAEALRHDTVRQKLDETPLDELKDTVSRRLPVRTAERAGLRTVAEVLARTPAELAELAGLTAESALALRAAAEEHAAQLGERTPTRIDLDPGHVPATRLVVALHRFRRVGSVAQRVAEPAERLDAELPLLLAAAARAGVRFRRVVLGRRRRAEVRGALSRLDALLAEADRMKVPARLGKAAEALARPPSSRAAGAAWRDFERRPAEYYASLEDAVGARRGRDAARGRLPAEVAEHVEGQELDDTYRRVALRGYQAFGARFALAQRRVLIGDEMGLGKTVQSIAALAHLTAIGRTHFLVVCPASVVVNWMREIGARSTLRAHRLHGTGREEAFLDWVRDGGVAVTTFDALAGLGTPAELESVTGVEVAMLVVDEAHYVKNPGARRSALVAQWSASAERALFLTGTPMENKVREFASLVSYLQPQLVPEVEAAPGPQAFRRAVAPAYLRRNQEDVLTELPEVVRTDEWVEFGGADFDAYRDAVEAGSFMAMRQAAYAPGDRRGSAKLDRLCEIVAEATENGRKVVVFSNFRGVLAAVSEALTPITRVVGPVSGSVPATARQEMVDELAAAPGGAVLVSQIQAGGVGLNMQAASVVVICEPQVKPTIEDQAVARAHRMGQVRSVQVHRLLVADSVDERMLELLGAKIELFDGYARRSETAAATSAATATHLSDAELARRVVEQEQRRLDVAPTTTGAARRSRGFAGVIRRNG